MEEFNLSKKMINPYSDDHDYQAFILVTDVKEFIKILKKAYLEIAINPKGFTNEEVIYMIDKLAGDKLNGGRKNGSR